MTSILPGNLGVIAAAGAAPPSAFANNGTTATSSWNLAGQITNGNRTITGANFSTRNTSLGLGTKTQNGGKHYFEYVINRLATTGSLIWAGVGFQISTTSGSSTPSGATDVVNPGQEPSSVAVSVGFLANSGVTNDFEVWNGGGQLQAVATAPVVGQVMGVALDQSGGVRPYAIANFAVNNVWIGGSVGGGAFVVGTGSLALTTPIYIICTVGFGSTATNGDVATLNNGSQCTYAPPSGYTYWG